MPVLSGIYDKVLLQVSCQDRNALGALQKDNTHKYLPTIKVA
jgi:hypothetical protein